MKYYLSFLFVLLLAVGSQAQTIQSLRISPANPTTKDTVYVYADLQFSSTGCQLSSKSYSQRGNSFNANTHHCVGLALAICNITDTFKLGILNAGTYDFNLILNSGSGRMPCTPGIVPNDQDTTSFTVTTVVGINETKINAFEIYPNPASDFISIGGDIPQIEELTVLDITGSEVLQINQPEKTIDVSKLSGGIYWIKFRTKNGVQSKKLVKR